MPDKEYECWLDKETLAIGANDTDRLALLEFRNKISADPFSVVSSWNASVHFCLWYGVKCSRQTRKGNGFRPKFLTTTRLNFFSYWKPELSENSRP
ncbi:putative receptor-like protein kinase At3g47110 [Mercurialis annua]|uniref:putative receptor-like protein kinase At3g47110 n=1 Tax=Mercurialis annua TaxID=3986 RepID=UPI0021605A45|nr:putative receptor-like protein kinase At3g47110 [Mercurialis annua]